MKLKNEELERYLNSFRKLTNIEFNDVRGYKIYKFITKLHSELETVNNYRKTVEDEYFVPDDTGTLRFKVDDTGTPILKEGKDANSYINEINSILSTDSDVDMIDINFTMDEMSKSSIPLSAIDWSIIGQFIIDVQEESSTKEEKKK